MLKIRMQRTGRINSPSYRIIVTEHARGPKTGKIVEKVGTYNPKTKERALLTDRIKYWISVGAQPSDTMHNMLVSEGIINAKKINVLPAWKAPVVEAPAEEPKAPVASEAAAEAPAPAEEAASEEATPESSTEETPETKEA